MRRRYTISHLSKFFLDLPIERKLLLVSAVPILALLMLSFLTYKSVTMFSHDEDRLNHVYHVQSASAEYMRLVVDLETGFRGFVLTQQPQFLQPYRAAKARVLSVGRSLKQMVMGNREQANLIDEAQQLVEQLIADKDFLIEQVKAGHPEEAIDYITTGKGRALMLGIRENMARFDSREVELLREALASSAEDRSLLLGIVVGGGALALILMILPLHLIARSITGPLVALAKTVGSATGGVVPQVPVLERADEIGDLTRVMHAMSAQIQQHIDQIKRSEQDLRLLNANLSASEAKYRGIVDHAPIGIFTVVDGRVVFSNRENWKLAGRASDVEPNPEEMWEAIHPEDREATYEAFLSAVREGRTFERVFRFLHPDGHVRKVLCRAIPINDAGNHARVYQGFNVDITALEQMRAQLSRVERLTTLGQVAAGIAHEIRNPLVGIGSTASLLLEEMPEEKGWKTDLATILRETRRLDRIVNQIVDYARPRELVPTTFSPCELLKETVSLLDRALEERDIVVTWNIDEQASHLEADRDQIKQVLLNIIQNAIEALPPKGQLDLGVAATYSQQSPGILITIHDHGKGIDPAILPRVFEPFFTTGKAHGTGLGLAICRNIIEAHGGEIHIHSERDKGTTVTIWLPRSLPVPPAM